MNIYMKESNFYGSKKGAILNCVGVHVTEDVVW